MIELILLCCFSIQPEIQTVYNFDIYSGEQVKPSPLIQKILEGRKKSTTDYTFKTTPDFYFYQEAESIFDHSITRYYWDFGVFRSDREFYPFRNIYNGIPLVYR